MDKVLCRVRVQLVAVDGTNALRFDLSPFVASLGITVIRGRLVLCDKAGNFRVKVGIQTYATDVEAPDAPIGITNGTGVAYVSSVGKNFVTFDPTDASNGNTSTKAGFRVGLIYSSTDATISRGDVLLELYASR